VLTKKLTTPRAHSCMIKVAKTTSYRRKGHDMLEAKNDIESGNVREFNTIGEFLDGIKQ